MKALILAAIAASATGCFMHVGSGTPGSGKLVTADRKVTDFTKVECRIGADVNVTAGKEFSLKLNVDDNLAKEIDTSVEKGVLVIRAKSQIDPSKCTITITLPKIERFDLDGAGDITITGVESKKFEAQIDGAGDMTISGKADEASLGIDGAGTIKAFDLGARAATAKIDGAGNIEVSASSALSAFIDGAGSIRYKGDPKVTEDIDGAGSVSKA